MENEKVLKGGKEYLETSKKDGRFEKVRNSPMKLVKTKRVISNCRVCFRNVQLELSGGNPQKMEDPLFYCDSCRNKLEKIWSE